LAFLGLNVTLAWVALQATLLFPHLVWHALAGQFLPGGGLAAYGRQFAMLFLAQGVVWVLTAALFLGWIHRAYGNLAAMGATGLRYSPHQAMAAFLVPGVNLVAPPRVMRELWAASGRRAPGTESEMPRVVAWWWGTLLLSVFVDLVLSARVGGLTSRVGVGGMPVMLLGEAIRIAAAVLAVVLVLRVNRDQGERLDRLAAGDPRRG
jgi:hypothetical protein